MSKYLLAYIDEEQEDREAFQNYFHEHEQEFQIEFIYPGGKSVNDIVDEIVDMNPDMVIVDYYLKNKDATVSDNGDTIIQRLSDRKPYLPATVLTSFMREAERSFLPPEKRNSIIPKEYLNDTADLKFKEVVIKYISYNRQLLDNYKSEFAELSKKSEKSEEEKARLLELDRILEELIDRQLMIRSEHKRDENIDEIKKLIISTKELLDKFKRNSDG